jgi:uncharacterized protein YbjT (DUF2867 family)
LGTALLRTLPAAGLSVRALVRNPSDTDKSSLASRGITLIRGDMTDTRSLEDACRDVDAIVAAATAVSSGPSIRAVDREANLQLVKLAERAQVKRFVFLSFPPIATACALQDAKRDVERALAASPLSWVVFQAGFFMEAWLSAKFGFVPTASQATVFGEGIRPISWISVQDVAEAILTALVRGEPTNTIVQLGGPEALPMRDVLDLCAKSGYAVPAPTLVGKDALHEMLAKATSDNEAAMAAIGLAAADGMPLDPATLESLLPRRPVSVAEFLARALADAHPSA